MAQGTQTDSPNHPEVAPALDRNERSPAWTRIGPVLMVGAFAVVTRLLSLLAVARGAHTGLGGAIRLIASDWDAYWYRYVVLHGYSVATQAGRVGIGFYPGYPMLARLSYEALHAPSHLFPWLTSADAARWSLLLVSNACLVVSLVALWRLFRPRLGARATMIGTALFLAAPGSFVLSAAFSESAFIAASVLAFLCAERRRWLWCGVLAGAAAVIRIDGVLLILPLTVLWLMADRRFSLQLAVGLAAAVAGVGAYPLFLGATFGDPLLYVNTKDKLWGAHWNLVPTLLDQISRVHNGALLVLRGASSGVPLPAHTSAHPRLFGAMLLLDQGTFIATLISVVPALIGLGLPYALWTILIDLAPLASGLDAGLTRYTLAAWPAYFAFGWLLRRLPAAATLTIVGASLVGMLVIAFDFTQGYFVL